MFNKSSLKILNTNNGELNSINNGNRMDFFVSPDNKLLLTVTDYQFFNSLTGNLYLSPSKWYDVRSVPPQNSDYFEDYKKFFLKRIKKETLEGISKRIRYMNYIRLVTLTLL